MNKTATKLGLAALLTFAGGTYSVHKIVQIDCRFKELRTPEVVEAIDLRYGDQDLVLHNPEVYRERAERYSELMSNEKVKGNLDELRELDSTFSTAYRGCLVGGGIIFFVVSMALVGGVADKLKKGEIKSWNKK